MKTWPKFNVHETFTWRLRSHVNVYIVSLGRVLSVYNNPASIYLVKVNSWIIRTIFEICSKLTIKREDDSIDIVLLSSLLILNRYTYCCGFSIVDFEKLMPVGNVLSFYEGKKRNPNEVIHMILLVLSLTH